MNQDLRVLALHKGEERYAYVYDHSSTARLLDEFRNQAADPRLKINWFDAAVLAGRVRPGDDPDSPRPGEPEPGVRAA